MITSPTPGAMVTVDSAAPTSDPFVGELKGGRAHRHRFGPWLFR